MTNIKERMRRGLRIVARLEARQNTAAKVSVSDDPDTGGLIFSCGYDVRRITLAEMLGAVKSNTVPELANMARQYVRDLADTRKPVCQDCKHSLDSEFSRNCACRSGSGLRRVSDGKTIAECNAESQS